MSFSGLAQKRLTACNLLPCLALARLTKPPRVEANRSLSVSVQCKAERSLHQSLPLQACRESRAAAGARTATLWIRARTLAAAHTSDGRADHATECPILDKWLILIAHWTGQSTLTSSHGASVAALVNLESWPRVESAESISRWDAAASVQSARGRQWQRKWQSGTADGHKYDRSGAGELSRAALLGLNSLLWAELSCGRSLSLHIDIGDCRWLYESIE